MASENLLLRKPQHVGISQEEFNSFLCDKLWLGRLRLFTQEVNIAQHLTAARYEGEGSRRRGWAAGDGSTRGPSRAAARDEGRPRSAARLPGGEVQGELGRAGAPVPAARTRAKRFCAGSC